MATESLCRRRADFDDRSKGSLSLPLAGALVWTVVAVLGLVLPPKAAVFASVFSTGAIFPLALAIARFRDEQVLGNPNPFAKLMGACVLMVNLLWVVHIPLLVEAPEFVPLSLGVSLGLHWVVYSWIIGHPLGYQHAIFRSFALLAAWWSFPEYRVTACALVIVAAYGLTLPRMHARLMAGHLRRSSPPHGAA